MDGNFNSASVSILQGVSSPKRSSLGIRPITTWKAEFKELRDVALPSALSNYCEYLPVLFLISFAGHSSSESASEEVILDAVSLGRAYFNCTGLSLGFGAISAVRTLFSQAVGSGNARLCAVYAQRAFIASFCMLIPCVFFQIYATQVLTALGQPVNVITLSGKFVIASMPTYLGWIWFAILQRVLQAHSRAYFPFISSIVMVIVSPLLLYLFMNVLKYSYMGAAYASNIYSFIPVFLIVPYMYYIDMSYIFKPVPLEEILNASGIRQYLSLSGPGLLQICLEWWILEAVSILAGLLPNAEVAIGASYVCLTLETFTVMGWLSLQVFNAVRVGYFIGARDVKSAKRSATVGVTASVLFSLLLSVLVVGMKDIIPKMFSTDPQVIELTSKLMLVLALVLPVDALINSVGGVMSGLGLQGKAALCQFVGYYVVGMPVIIVLVFVYKISNPVLWLWGGLFLAMLTSSAMQLIILWRYDWQDAVKEALNRIAEESRIKKHLLLGMLKKSTFWGHNCPDDQYLLVNSNQIY